MTTRKLPLHLGLNMENYERFLMCYPSAHELSITDKIYGHIRLKHPQG